MRKRSGPAKRDAVGGRAIDLVVTCEHASATLPAQCKRLGLPARVLRSHVAWDPGARHVARRLARRLRCPYLEGRYSRLLVDLNRSETNPRVVPRRAFGTDIPGNARISLAERGLRLRRYWAPHRRAVHRAVDRVVAQRRFCLHVGIHSFVPVLSGRVRDCDVGLLYDPAHGVERALAMRLRHAFAARGLKVRLNFPYTGTADGLTTTLRKAYSAESYAGIEVELNQRLLRNRAAETHIVSVTAAALSAVLMAHPAPSAKGGRGTRPK